MLLLGILAYVGVQLIIGLVVSTRIRTNEDYILAGRGLGYGMGTFTIFATWFGAESCIGSAGEAYERGMVAGEVDPFGYALCLVVMGLFFAARYWRAGFLTMADLFRRRYSVGVERMAVALLVPTSVIWGSAQLRAFGQVLASSANVPIVWGITLAIVVTLIYTVAGGMWADAVTDLVQGIAVIFGLVMLAVLVFMRHDGWALIEQVPPERLSLFPTGESRPWYVILNAWSVPVLNAVVAQELVARTLASRSAVVARNNCFLAGGMYLVVGLIPLTLGILGPMLVGHLDHPEQILPTLAREHMNDFFYILFAGAIISALLSTIDSALLVSASLMANNLLPLPADQATERRKIMWSRTWVVILGLSAYVVTFFSDSVFDLAQEASSLGASALFVVVAFALFTGFGGTWAAAATMMTGLGTYVFGKFSAEWNASFLLSLIAALVSYVTVAIIERLLGRSTKRLEPR